jgi:succinyl-CoA synthetase alpha subunit
VTTRSLAPLFSPESVAVVGASADQRKWGNWLARGALRGEARRPAYLVNHRAPELLGRRAYASLADLPERPDLVVIAVPFPVLDAAVDEALRAGARAIVAISAGGDGSSDAALGARVAAAGAVLLGPNCLGVLDSGEQLELISNPLPPGSIGLISQSGNLALELGLLAAPEGLGFSRFASLGNQADLGATELVRAFSEHDATRLIALYIEDFRDGREFARAAEAAVRAGKPVLALAIEDGAATSRAVAPTPAHWPATARRSTPPAGQPASRVSARRASSSTRPRRSCAAGRRAGGGWPCSPTGAGTGASRPRWQRTTAWRCRSWPRRSPPRSARSCPPRPASATRSTSRAAPSRMSTRSIASRSRCCARIRPMGC